MTHDSEIDCDIHESNEIKSHAFHHIIEKRLEQDFAAYSVYQENKAEIQAGTEYLRDG